MSRQRNHFGTFWAGSSNEVLKVWQITDVYSGNVFYEAIEIHSDEKKQLISKLMLQRNCTVRRIAFQNASNQAMCSPYIVDGKYSQL